MEVRLAERHDSAAVVALLRQLGYNRDQASIETDLEGNTGDVIVATIDDQIVGLLSLSMHRPLHRGGVVAAIDSLVVDEAARSAGIGGALIDAAVRRAATANCVLVELHSNQERTRARQFYERQGFHVTGNYFVRPLT